MKVSQRRSHQAYTPLPCTLVISSFPFGLNASPRRTLPSAWQRKPTTFLNLPKPRISKLLYPRAPWKTARESLSWSNRYQENEIIYTLLASIAEAINTLEGLKTDVHQKVISLIYLDCSFISYTTSTSRDSFISSYCTHHNLETIPTPTIHPLSITHASANERDTELLLHTKSLLGKNIGQQYCRCSLMWLMPLRSLSNCDYELNFYLRLILGPIHSNQVMGTDPVGSYHGTRNSRSNSINPTYPYQLHD